VGKRKVRTGPHRPTELSSAFAPYSGVWGVYVGDGCVSGGSPLEWRAVEAHAHNRKSDEWFGWICVADQWAVVTENGNLTVTMKHEIAHILCPDSLHGARWRAAVTALGAPQEAKKYERRSRG